MTSLLLVLCKICGLKRCEKEPGVFFFFSFSFKKKALCSSFSGDIQGLFNLQGRPIVICDKDDHETIKNSCRTIKVPHCVDCLQGILSVIPLQLLSFHLAVLRGYDVGALSSDSAEKC